LPNDAAILADYRSTRSPFRTARNLGIRPSDVWVLIEKYPDEAVAPPARFGGFGPPEMRKYIVARRRVGHVWDNKDPDLASARHRYELGVVELATGRDGNTEILYAIPRRKREPRLGYFKNGT
jgi:hypothetical protein